MQTLTLATRGSKLALVQANMVKAALEARGVAVEIRTVSTKGDLDQVSPLREIGGKGLFVAGIEEILQQGQADIAVHSGKDLPYKLAEGLTIAGVLKAADPRDCLLTRCGETLTENAVIGTGSPRREAECKRFYPKAEYRSIRGNVDTRLQKLRDGFYDGILLAKAGLDRLQPDLSGFSLRVFEVDEFLPSPCQGILAVECRECDSEIVQLLQSISDTVTARRFAAERYMLQLLECGCDTPVGAHAEVRGDDITIVALYQNKKATRSGKIPEYKKLCESIKEEIYG